MDFSELRRSFEAIWENKPGPVFLLALGFVVFVFLVIDARRHKRRRKSPRPFHWQA
jgi:hypothetical protein